MAETGVSHRVALAWGLAAAPQRGPKRELSLERIVDAAIEIADAEGLGAVTMQRVAKTFDFSTMALYRYVATKDDLHQLMMDTAMSRDLQPIVTTDWREGVRQVLAELVRGYRQHPWTMDIPLAPDMHVMPGHLRVADIGLRAMRELPIPSDAKLGALMLLSAYARGHAEIEREVLTGVEIGPATRALLTEAVSLGEFPDVGALVHSGVYFGGGSDAIDHQSSTDDDRRSVAESEADEMLGFAAQVLNTGLEAVFSALPLEPERESESPTPVPALTPQQTFELAEAKLREQQALRKEAQQLVRQREREVAELQRTRDRAKELAKAHEKFRRREG